MYYLDIQAISKLLCLLLFLFGGSSAEIIGQLKECRDGVRNVLKVSELNHSVKEWSYQESLRGKHKVVRSRVRRNGES